MDNKGILRSFLSKHWFFYVISAILALISNFDNSLMPRVLGQFTDELQKGDLTQSSIVAYSLEVLIIGVTYVLMFALSQLINHQLGRKFEFLTRQRLFQKFSSLSDAFFAKHGTGKLLSYVMNDLSAVRESISMGLNQTMNAVFLLIASVAMLLLSSIPLYVMAICVSPLIIIPFLVVRFGPQIRQRSLRVQESLASMTEAAEEQFGGIRVTKTFALEGIAQDRYGARVDSIRDAQLRLVRLSSMFQALLPFLGSLSLMIAVLLGGYLTTRGHISLGDFVALTLYLRMMSNPLQQVGNVINVMQRARASFDRINELLAVVPDIQDADNAVQLTSIRQIRVTDLTFTYPGHGVPSLRNIDLTIPFGRTVGIVGKTGSGKTTMVKLLLRVYEAPKGSILIDGLDISQVKIESLRSNLAYVPQDGFLFSTTFRDNIAFGDRDTDLGNIEWGARQAMIYDSIVQFPEHFNTKLGERGITLSGGQRQRTSLARGLVRNAPILIMDDSVSAVDTITEAAIVSNLRQTRKNKTTLIISHRISAVKHADEIIVMDEGRIVERGTHDELIAAEGLYARLHNMQQEGVLHG